MLQLKLIAFTVYLFLFGMYGIELSSFGPAIIYFSKFTQRDETSFSYIFIAKTVGSLFGGLIMKILPNYFSYHRLLALSIICSGLALIISSLDFGFWNLSITLGIVGAVQCMIDILCTLCIFQLFFKEDEEYWLQVCHIFVGVGGLIGPVIVVLTEQLSLRAIGIIFFLCLTPILMLKSPQGQKKGGEIQQQEQQKGLLQLPFNIQIGLCLLMFTYVGIIGSYLNWMPTYAIKSGALNETAANLLVSIFWIVELVAKVLLLFLKDTVPNKAFLLLKFLLLSATILIVLQWLQYFTLVCYFGVISAGFFLSALYAFFYTIAQSYGYRLSQSATANITVFSVLAEGMLTPIGYLVGEFGFKAFVYILFAITATIFGIFVYTNQAMEKNSKQKKAFLENSI